MHFRKNIISLTGRIVMRNEVFGDRYSDPEGHYNGVFPAQGPGW